MVLPFAAAILGGGASTILDYALGRPMNLWGRSIDADQTPAVRQSSYASNNRRPNVLPAPDAIIEAFRRGLLEERVTEQALAYQGVYRNLSPLLHPDLTNHEHQFFDHLWEQVGKMRESRPDPASIMRMYARGRISWPSENVAIRGYDADWAAYQQLAQAEYQIPGLSDLLQLRRMDVITNAEYDQATRAMGWYDRFWLDKQERVVPLPGVAALMRLSFMGQLQDDDYARYMRALGHTDPGTRALIESEYYRIPGIGDLVSFAVREGWDEGVVRRWGYDAEFPEPLRFWAKAQGYDWGRSFVGSDQREYASVHWPKLYWRAHWNPMPLGFAHRAFHQYRPERIARYQQQYPGLQPFTRQHLDDVIKIADYPPAVRTWLAALNAPILPIMTVRLGYRLGAIQREEARQQMLDRGYVPADAQIQLDVIDKQNQDREFAWERNLVARANTQLAHEILAGYADGLVPADEATTRLASMGVRLNLIPQLLALEDSRQLRITARSLLRALRRDFLAGSMQSSELQAALLSIPISPPQAQRYLARWSAERSLERRTLSTAQVAAQVAAGALEPAAGLARLANLGWVAPDSLLLIQQAERKHAAQLTHAAAQQASQAKRLRMELERASRQARAAVRQAQQDLRRITPVASLRRWFQLGIRRSPWVRERLLAQGYDSYTIDALLYQWTLEYEMAGGTEPPAVKELQTLLRRQTPLATIRRWYQRGVATKSWTTRRLNDAGWTPESISGFIAEWDATLPKGAPGPAPEGSPFPAKP